MTKKKLDPDYAKRMLQAFIQRHEIDIGKASVDIETALHKGNLNQAFLIESQTRDHKIRIQIYKLALAQLEEQEKCCGNCANRKDENGECEFLTDQINIENDSEVSLCVSLVNYCRDGWKERKEE